LAVSWHERQTPPFLATDAGRKWIDSPAGTEWVGTRDSWFWLDSAAGQGWVSDWARLNAVEASLAAADTATHQLHQRLMSWIQEGGLRNDTVRQPLMVGTPVSTPDTMGLTWHFGLMVLAWIVFYPIIDRAVRQVNRGNDATRLARRGRVEANLARAFGLLMVTSAVEVQPIVISAVHHANPMAVLEDTGVLLGVGVVFIAPLMGMLAMLRGRVLALLAASAGPAVLYGIFGGLALLFIYARPLMVVHVPSPEVLYFEQPLLAWKHLQNGSAFYLAALAGSIVTLVTLNVNRTSMHAFYRDRLMSAYVVASRKMLFTTVVEPQGDILISEVSIAESGAPYHLVNAAVNLQGASDLSLRGRASDFFLFSKYFIGSVHTGYCRTAQVENNYAGIHLGSAVAISGAAAAPNMGTFSAGSTAVLLALLNVRMGYWMANPAQIFRAAGADNIMSAANRAVTRASATLLYREFLGALRGDTPSVYLSDGGHIENLGVYELLRRRCRFVIVGDGEADPEMHFVSLAGALRYARLDLGIEVDIDLDAMRIDETGTSNAHWCVGVIYYPATESELAMQGYVLYFKSAVTGDEDEIITQYRAANPDFPHETTADQFFDEAQFEAYRDLGLHSVRGMFDDASGLEKAFNTGQLLAWFERRTEEIRARRES
jgi:hypothetical protein